MKRRSCLLFAALMTAPGCLGMEKFSTDSPSAAATDKNKTAHSTPAPAPPLTKDDVTEANAVEKTHLLANEIDQAQRREKTPPPPAFADPQNR